MSTKKRVVPNFEMRKWRAEFLQDLSTIHPLIPDNKKNVALELGNKKTGTHGRFFNSVFVWNLPSVVTCPCASRWCLCHCYNADSRSDVFPIDIWKTNWWMSINEPERLKDNIVDQIKKAQSPSAVRLHSSGDFYSTEYIEMWYKISTELPETKFWTYTRSWVDDKLREALNKLQVLNNFEIFGSWDSSMGLVLPPTHWRWSYVQEVHNNDTEVQGLHRKSLICPEQTERLNSCADCAFCLRAINKDIIFYFH